MTEKFFLQFAPKRFVTEDDFYFTLKYLQVSKHELQIIFQALKEALGQSSADKDFKPCAISLLKNLSSEESILSEDGKILARLLAKSRISGKTYATLKKIILKDRKNRGEKVDWDKINHYIEKVFTSSRFSEWSESICTRASVGALSLLHKFVNDPEITLVFSNKKSKMVLVYPFVNDPSVRKHLLMKDALQDPLLHSIINGKFKVLQIVK